MRMFSEVGFAKDEVYQYHAYINSLERKQFMP